MQITASLCTINNDLFPLPPSSSLSLFNQLIFLLSRPTTAHIEQHLAGPITPTNVLFNSTISAMLYKFVRPFMMFIVQFQFYFE